MCMRVLALLVNKVASVPRVDCIGSDRVLKWYVAVVSTVCLGLASGFSATYHVAKSGSNTNPGTEAAPWLTIQHAANSMVSGDTVIVAAGHYGEVVRVGPVNTTFRAESTNAVTAAFVLTNASITVDGFTLTGGDSYASFWVNSVNASNYLVQNCFFASSPYGETKFPLMVYWGLSPAPSGTVRSNTFRDWNYTAADFSGSPVYFAGNFMTASNGWDAIRNVGANSIIAGNTFSVQNYTNANHCDLIQVWDATAAPVTNVLIESNFSYNCPGTQIMMIENNQNLGLLRDWTIRNNIYAEVELAGHIYAEGFKLYNNTFYRCGINTSGALLFRYSTTKGAGHSGIVYNNIFFECGAATSRDQGWYDPYYGVTNCAGNHNLVVGTGAGTSKSATKWNLGEREAQGLNGTDPLFVNPALGTAAGFRLQVSSPCIGAGTNLNAFFTTDKDGVTRGASWDIGACEYTDAVSPGVELSRVLNLRTVLR